MTYQDLEKELDKVYIGSSQKIIKDFLRHALSVYEEATKIMEDPVMFIQDGTSYDFYGVAGYKAALQARAEKVKAFFNHP